MAVFPSNKRPVRQSHRSQALIWLMTTLILGVVTALVWMFSQTPAMGAKIKNEPIAAPEVAKTELKQPLKVESLHELDTDVQPIDFEATVRDLRNYPDEFKDKRYLIANKGKWTVQVMNVAENDVVANYLEGRSDRKKFAYFRYRDENNQLRYMLTYGLMSSPQEAVGAAKLIDFNLPANVRVLPEEISRYISVIDNYERPEPLKDLSTQRSRAVRLQPTKREVPVRQPEPTPKDNTSDSSSAASSNSRSVESIRQSDDTSETLAVNEQRILSTDGDAPAPTNTPAKNNTPKNEKKEEKPAKVEPEPKKQSGNNNSNNGNGGNNSNSGNDSMKALIEDKIN